MVDVSVLESVEFLHGLSRDSLEEIAAGSEVRHLRRGEWLFKAGDEGDELFVLLSGRMGIVLRSPEGRESMVALMGPGDLFGELSLLDGHGRSAGARSLEPCDVLGVPFAPMTQALLHNPEAQWNVIRMLSARLRRTDQALADTIFLDVPGRTAKRLLELAGSSDAFQLPVTQEELAGLVGASRERVNKAIASFVRLGWIVQSGRRYRILDREQLEHRAR